MLEEVFQLVLTRASDKKMLGGMVLGVDSTTLEANAAMKTNVRRKTREPYKEYLRRLAEEAGVEDPSDDDLRRFDRNRPAKTRSNDEWKSPTDPDARIERMKEGRTRRGYTAEHAVDLENDIVVAAEIYHCNEIDVTTLVERVARARSSLFIAGEGRKAREIVADKGYHSTANLCDLADSGLIPIIADRHGRRRWSRRTGRGRDVVYANRRRNRTKRGWKLQRLRSEMNERSFAHVCDQGGEKWTWMRGLKEVAKRYLMQVAPRNLSTLMRKLFGVG